MAPLIRKITSRHVADDGGADIEAPYLHGFGVGDH